MKYLRVAWCASLLMVSATASFAQTPAEFYGRTSVRLIISADPGGSYDQIGRLVSRHLGKHIPGNPRVVPENMLGASGRVAANYLYHAAPKDGSVIGGRPAEHPDGPGARRKRHSVRRRALQLDRQPGAPR